MNPQAGLQAQTQNHKGESTSRALIDSKAKASIKPSTRRSHCPHRILVQPTGTTNRTTNPDQSSSRAKAPIIQILSRKPAPRPPGDLHLLLTSRVRLHSTAPLPTRKIMCPSALWSRVRQEDHQAPTVLREQSTVLLNPASKGRPATIQ